jgi:hypothetical protein
MSEQQKPELIQELPPNANGKKMGLFRCFCETKTEFITGLWDVRTNHTKSCGCLKLKTSSENGKKNKTYGLTKTPEYHTWIDMIQRCENKNAPGYPTYGGRGITVCKEWRNDFLKFLTDMGKKPGKRFTIDRIDNNLGYYKENCRWATTKTQNNNRRSNKKLTIEGEEKTMQQWAEEREMNKWVLQQRKSRGWSDEDTLNKPIRRHNLTYEGKTQTLAAWAREKGVDKRKLSWRLNNGWTPEEAFGDKRPYPKETNNE